MQHQSVAYLHLLPIYKCQSQMILTCRSLDCGRKLRGKNREDVPQRVKLILNVDFLELVNKKRSSFKLTVNALVFLPAVLFLLHRSEHLLCLSRAAAVGLVTSFSAPYEF